MRPSAFGATPSASSFIIHPLFLRGWVQGNVFWRGAAGQSAGFQQVPENNEEGRAQ